ncbi:hypothetical protein KFU94_59460 [Chloroflexi bacterium TSY]|nr:hypothetical protein [Chloroflexi bacterium TSY]
MSTNLSPLMPRIRWGIWGLPLAGLCFLIGLLLRGEPANDAATDPTHFAQAVTAPSYIIGWSFLIFGMVLLIFGYLALYGYLASTPVERRASFALLLSVTGTALQIGFFSILSFVAMAIGQNYLAGQTGGIDVMSTLFAGPLIIYLAVATLLYLVGTVMFAVAIGGSPTLPRWTGILLPVYYLLFLAPAFQLTGITSLIIESLGAALLILAGAGLIQAMRS